MVKVAIIIPSYIKVDSPQDIGKSDGFRLLKRALSSLKILKGPDIRVILPFCIEGEGINKGMVREYHNMLMKILDTPFPFKRIVLTASNLETIKRYISQNGFYDIAERLSVCGFPNIRNCGLIAAQAIGAEAIIFLDNDEVIEAGDFIDTALEGLFTPVNGHQMDGKGGFYMSQNGAVYDKVIQPWWQTAWKKMKLFEEVWENILDAKERFVESPVILGGNVVLTARLFEHIPFDPMVPRGEDIDYLINARVAGFEILFDKQMKIKHLPSERTVLYRKEELKGDIERFIYERAKIIKYKMLNLAPYPGYFLKRDLEAKAIITVILFSLYLVSNYRWNDAIKVYTYLSPLFRKMKDQSFYKKFKERWERLMEFIRLDGLKDILKESSL